jgi:1-acyl-sn-glycerol-3-phosphate acyltransferase
MEPLDRNRPLSSDFSIAWRVRTLATLAVVRWIVVGLKTILTWTVGVVNTLVCTLIVLAIAFVNDTSPVIDRIILFWSRTWLATSGSRVTVTGRENIDPNRSYVVVANHLSTLDIMSCFVATRLPIRFLAKKELFRIPVFAQGMRAVGNIEVDRQARGTAHTQLNAQAKELISKKRSLIIYPEGTRPRDGVMKPFKKGAFTMAVASGLPVLPLSIHGTYEACPSGRPWFFGGPIEVVIDHPIETKEMTQADTGALRDQVREIIAGRVSNLGGEVA